MKRYASLALALLLCPVLATAQVAPHDDGMGVFGVITSGVLWDDEGSLGRGVSAGGGVGFRWPGALGVEARIERFDHTRSFDSGVRFEASGTRVLGRVLYHFSEGRVQPYVAGALAYMKADRTSRVPVYAPGSFFRPVQTGADVFEHSLNESLWGGGVGARFSVTPRFPVRPEFGILVSSPSHYLTLQAGVAAGWRW